MCEHTTADRPFYTNDIISYRKPLYKFFFRLTSAFFFFFLPQNQPSFLSGGVQIDKPLVGAAPEPQGDIVLGFNKFAVHQHIQQAQQLVGGFAPGKTWLFAGQLLPGVAGICLLYTSDAADD